MGCRGCIPQHLLEIYTEIFENLNCAVEAGQCTLPTISDVRQRWPGSGAPERASRLWTDLPSWKLTHSTGQIQNDITDVYVSFTCLPSVGRVLSAILDHHLITTV